MKPGRGSLEALLQRSGVGLPRAGLELLWRYHGMLRAANARLNLSRLHNFETIVVKHYVDSLLVLKFTELPSPLVDMGSGAGLPGVPLAIARPETRFILAEPRGARAEFLKEVCAALPLPNVRVHAGRVGPDYQEKAAGVIARAVTSVAELLGRVRYCLEPGGRVLLMKGPECDSEIIEAQKRHGDAFHLEADHAYEIPGTAHQRRLIEYIYVHEIDGSRDQTGGPQVISSTSNAVFQGLRELLSGRGIRGQGRALIAGPKIVAEVVRDQARHAAGWVTNEASAGPPEGIAGVEWIRLSDALFRELDVAGTHAPLLLVNVPEMADWRDEEPWPEGCTLFVPFQDPENVGAVIRSAAAFGAARVVLLREAAHPFHPKATRAAGPAAFQARLLRGPALAELRARGAPMYALSGAGTDLSEVEWPAAFGLVAGVEGPGLPAHVSPERRVRIPMAAGVESLNAAVSVSIALYEVRRRSGRNKPTA